MRAAAVTALVLLANAATASGQGLPVRPSPLNVVGYADIGYLETERPVADGFQGARLVGQATYAFADRWSFFGELVARAHPELADVSLTRAFARYDLHRALRVSAGRFRTPVAYGTTAFLPGAWTQTTLEPPDMVDAERGFLPIYAVGLRADGIIAAGALEIGYATAVANGRDTEITSPGDAGDTDRRRAWMLGAHVRPRALRLLRVGGGIYRDRPATEAEPEIAERILTAHLAWEGERPEILAEYARVRHLAGTSAEEYVGWSNYAQLAFRLVDRLDAWKPYIRWERIETADGDPLYPPETLRHDATTIGIRYDFIRAGALKAEYRLVRLGTAERFAEFGIQAAFRLAAPQPPPVLAAASPPAEGPAASGEATKAAPARSEAPARSDAAASSSERRRTAAGQAAKPDAAAHAIAVVVNPKTRVSDLSLPELRRIFRGEQQSWPDGGRVVLLLRSPLPAERDIVLGRIYQMDEVQLRQFWLEKIFRDAAAAGPKMVSDLETARALVGTLQGAITFMPADQVGSGLRVLRIEGKLPGEDGYPLQ